jgi:hypothetical protein
MGGNISYKDICPQHIKWKKQKISHCRISSKITLKNGRKKFVEMEAK